MDRHVDGMSAAEAAARLGTSIPRVVRAVKALALDAGQANGRYLLTETDFGRLSDQLGVTPSIPGLTATETRALAALGRAPLGLRSVRAVAERAGISPTAASRALSGLRSHELVYTETLLVAAGHVQSVTMWHANRLDPRWKQLSASLARVLPPRPTPPPQESVPRRLRHLFWNTADAQLEVGYAGPYIAQRLLRTMDPEGLAWGARNLTARDWLEAAGARGLEPSVKALAENLAAASSPA